MRKIFVGLICSVIFAGCADTTAKREPLTFKFYGAFCGPGVPATTSGATLDQQISELDAIPPRDDLDALCKAHDICYVNAARDTVAFRAKIDECDAALIDKTRPMAETFNKVHAEFGVYTPEPLDPDQFKTLVDNCSLSRRLRTEARVSYEKGGAALRRIFTYEKFVRHLCAERIQLAATFRKPEKDRRLVAGLIQYGRCKIVADGIISVFRLKRAEPDAILFAPLRAALFGFEWVYEDGLPGQHEKCDATPDPKLMQLFKDRPLGW